MRLFVAAEVPDSWREAVAGVQGAIERASGVARADDGSGGDVRWVDPALLHVTLCFLGAVDPSAVPRLGEALDRAVPPLDLTLALGDPGTFGPPARTSVIWLGLGGDTSQLSDVARRVEAAVTGEVSARATGPR